MIAGALEGLQAVLIVFLLIGAGVLAAWRKWLSPDTARALPRLIMNFALPCNIVTSFYSSFSSAREDVHAAAQTQLVPPWIPLLIAFAVVLLSFAAGFLAARVFRIPRERRGVFIALFALSNSVFIGFPVAQALFGDKGMTYAVYYYLANTTCFWTLGYTLIRRDADFVRGEQSQIKAGEVFKNLVTPPLVTIAVMFIVVFSGIKLPQIVLDFGKYGGGLTTPLSLIFTGCTIFEAGIKGLRYERGIGAVMFGRFVLTPAMCFFACMLAFSLLLPGAVQARVDELILMRNVLTTQIGLPVMTLTVIVSQRYGADALYATRGVVWTTLASLVTIPAMVLLFQAV